ARCYERLQHRSAGAGRVSILTGPEGPVLQHGLYLLAPAHEFQSSPGPKARCYLARFIAARAVELFQSSPGPKARCYPPTPPPASESEYVSILTGPEGPVLPVYWHAKVF